jgi:hypothetical protein
MVVAMATCKIKEEEIFFGKIEKKKRKRRILENLKDWGASEEKKKIHTGRGG